MFYDLNVRYAAQDQQLPRTLAFLYELGYNVVALNHTISGKLPAEIKCPIPDAWSNTNIPPKLTVLRRVTLILTESHQNARLAALAKEYDVLAVRPIDERTLSLACGSLDCDIISIDMTQRLPFYFKYKMLAEAVKAGKRFEICYSQALVGDVQGRRNLISNATQLIRASRGRGLLLCSEASGGPLGCRGPWDVINLASVWGLGQERGHDGLTKEARNVVVTAKLKKTGWRGVIDVVQGGERPTVDVTLPKEPNQKQNQKSGKQKQKEKNNKQQGNPAGQKRKADVLADSATGKEMTQRGGNPAKHPKQ